MADNLKILLGMDNSNFDRGISKAQSKITAFKGLMGGIGGVLMIAQLRQITDKFDAIGKAAESAGMSASSFKNFEHHANLAGVSAEKFKVGMVNLKDAADRNMDSFAKLGVEVRSASGESKSSEQLMYELSDAIKSTGNSAQTAAEINKIFGKEVGGQMVRMLADGSSALKATTKDFESYNDAVQAAADANDVIAGVSSLLEGIFSRALGTLLLLKDGITDLFSGKGFGDTYHERQNERAKKARKKREAEEDAARAAQLQKEADAAQKFREEQAREDAKSEEERAKAKEKIRSANDKMTDYLAKEKGLLEEIRLTNGRIADLKLQMSFLDKESVEYAELYAKLADLGMQKRTLEKEQRKRAEDAAQKAEDAAKKAVEDRANKEQEINNLLEERRNKMEAITKEVKAQRDQMLSLMQRLGRLSDRRGGARAERYDAAAESDMASGNYASSTRNRDRAEKERQRMVERRQRRYDSQMRAANARFSETDRAASIAAIEETAKNDPILNPKKENQELINIDKKLGDQLDELRKLTDGLGND